MKIHTVLSAVTLVVFTLPVQSSAQQASLDLQEKCAKQARVAFNNMSFRYRDLASYTNHYNVKLNRCFIETEQEGVPQGNDTAWTYKFLSDANEGKIFGSYVWHTDKIKKYWEVTPVQCEVTMLSGEQKVCKSSDEFDDLIKVYMQ